jgi:hypothetical protein
MLTPNFINILGSSCFMDATGSLMAKGRLTVTAVDASGKAVPFHVGGGGIALVHTISRAILNGSLTAPLQLANPAAADISVGYNFVITDSSSFEVTPFNAVAIVADASGNFDLSALNAGNYAQAEPVVYLAGPAGPAATVSIGATTTLPAGSTATVTNTGTASAAVLNFGIPQGAAGTDSGGAGTQGPQGDPGLSAYQEAVLDGFSGTLTQWLASLVGPKGDKGDPGTPGTPGTPGAAGTPATPNSASAPLTITGNNIAIAAATDTVDGYLTHADHAAFAAKQAALGFTPLNPGNNLSEVTPAAARANLGLAAVAASGAYADLTGKPSIPAGTVTSVSSADANATVATGTSTPVITIVSAPKLTTARTINGTSFDGSANITVTAAAGTLTGSTLASGVSVPASQVTGLAPSATTDTTNASNISTGTIPTAATAALTGDVTKAAGASATVVTAVNGVSVTGTPGAGQVITATGPTAATWQPPASSGVGTFMSWNNQATVAASTTAYYLPYAASTSAIESRVQFPVPFAGTVKNLFVWVSTANNAQSATGSLVLTVRKNGAATGLTVTIPAGSTTTTVQSDTNPAHSFTVAAGDLLSLQVVNNATVTSAGIASCSVVIQ